MCLPSAVRTGLVWLSIGAGLLVPAGSIHPQDAISVGYAVIRTEEGGQAVGTALFTLENPQGILISQAGVAAVEPIRSGRIFVDQKGSQRRTGIALVNASQSAVVLFLVLRDAAGRQMGQAAIHLDPGRHLALFIDELFPELSRDGTFADFAGSLSLETESPEQRVAAVTLRQSLNLFEEPILATLPVVPLDSQTNREAVIFPHIGAGAAEGGMRITTQIVLIPRDERAVRGRIRFFDGEGFPMSLEKDGETASDFLYEIDPGGVYRGEFTAAAIRAGYAVASVEEGESSPAGSAIFQFVSEQGIISEAGVGEGQATTRARIFVENVRLPNGAQSRTGVAIANPGQAENRLLLRLLDLNGIELEGGSTEAPARGILPAEGHLALFADEVFELPSGFTGLVEVSSPRPFVAITLKLTANQRGHPILTTLPVADLTRPPAPGLLVFPQIAFGTTGVGEFSTRLILINPGEDRELRGSLSFFESSGTALVVPLAGETVSKFGYTVPGGGGRQLRPGNTATAAGIILDLLQPELSEIVVNKGNTTYVRPLAIDSRGELRDDFELRYQSLDLDIAAVDGLGAVRGLERGFSALTVSAQGVVTAATITVVEVTAGAGGFRATGVVQDPAGRLYLAGSQSHTILLMDDLRSVPVTYAGIDQTAGFVDATRLQAQFRNPAFLALEHNTGELFVSDSANDALRRVEPGSEGRVETLALRFPPGQDGLRNPQGTALDHRGNLWVADSANHVIRRIDLRSGEVRTIAGLRGAAGFVDGSGEEARFNEPTGIALVSEPLSEALEREIQGLPPPPVKMIVADRGNGVLRQVQEDGVVRTFGAGTSTEDGRGVALQQSTATSFQSPVGVAVDPVGNVYVSEETGGQVRVLLGGAEVVLLAQARTFSAPKGIFISRSGRILIVEDDGSPVEVVFGAPEIRSATPSSARAGSGTPVTLEGRNFAPDSVVVLGGHRLAEITVRDTQTITFLLPSDLPSGLTTLTVQNRGGLSQTAFLVQAVPLIELSPGEITTAAGGATFAGDGSLATEAFLAPSAVAVDSFGSVFVADPENNRVRRIDPQTGIITTAAGDGRAGFRGDADLALTASLNAPSSIAFDGAGDLVIADSWNDAIRRVERATGVITTIAGGRFGFSGDGGPATEATLYNPGGVALDARRNLVYIADTCNHRVRRVDLESGIITTFAGGGEPSTSCEPKEAADSVGDGADPSNAALNLPVGLAVDVSGRLYIADRNNHRIRRLDPISNTITTVAGTGQEAYSGDGGPAQAAALNQPEGIFVDREGTLFIADTGNNRIRRVDPQTGIITTVAGNGDFDFAGDGGPATGAALEGPGSVAVDGGGNLLIADSANRRVRRVDARTGIISTLAGNGEPIFLGEDGPPVAAALGSPETVAADGKGNLFIVDTLNHRIRRVVDVLQGGTVGTAAGGGSGLAENEPATQAQLSSPFGIALDAAGNLYIADTFHHLVRKVDSHTQAITTIAGRFLVRGFAGDGGPAAEAVLRTPVGVAVDGEGHLFIADSGNDRIRRIDRTTGIISTVAGGGNPPEGVGDGGPATEASLRSPGQIAFDSLGNLYIADTLNYRIRKVDSQGTITTVAGGGEEHEDGIPATSALLVPAGIALDAAGNLFITDITRIRQVDADGMITTAAGIAFEHGSSGDGGPARNARLMDARGVALDENGNLFVADMGSNRIRAVRGAGLEKTGDASHVSVKRATTPAESRLGP